MDGRRAPPAVGAPFDCFSTECSLYQIRLKCWRFNDEPDDVILRPATLDFRLALDSAGRRIYRWRSEPGFRSATVYPDLVLRVPVALRDGGRHRVHVGRSVP